jgi:Ca2+-binding RTX toxin-like protein
VGHDSIGGGNGNDDLFGDGGRDTIFGGADNDSIDGGTGSDRLFGDTGLDTIFGGTGGDAVSGGADNDSIDGGIGDDRLRGNAGDDTVSGGVDNDSIDGGIGNDDLFGDVAVAAGSAFGDGADIIDGNTGDDFIVGDAFASYHNRGAEASGSGDDTMHGDGGRDFMVGDADGYYSTFSGSGDDVMDGGDDSDFLIGDARGHDCVGSGNDVMHGGDGNDGMVGDTDGYGVADVATGSGNDTMYGDGGDDHMYGDARGSYAYGSGNDVMHGGSGDDFVLGDADGAGASNSGAPDGGDDLIYGDAGNDTLVGSGSERATGDYDTISGGDGNDRISGQGGDDVLQGGAGADYLYGGADNDVMDGGDDGDVMVGDAYYGSGNDVMYGGGGDDQLSGAAGTDLLTGSEGNDTLDGGAGADTAVFAGKVADYEITTVAGVTTVTDLDPSADGDDGTDTLRSVEQLQFVDGVVTVPKPMNSIDLATLTANQGFVIYGADAHDVSGNSVSSAGDVNGDGFDDFIIGALSGDAAGNTKPSAGESYVIFGTAAGFGASLDLAALTPDQGFVVYGADEGDTSGASVSAAGDVNGDGFDDLIIGAPLADAAGNAKTDAGESYVIFGTNAGFAASVDLAQLTADQGFVIYGADVYDRSGNPVSSAGDVNGDGFDDLIIGAKYADAAGNAKTDAGESYVIFGTAAGFGASIDLAALTPNQGFVIYGADEGDLSGRSVSGAGDVNGDGFDDLFIGAPDGDAAGNTKDLAGESYVIFGTAAGFGASLDLAALTPNQGFVIYGADERDLSGYSVSGAGDVNGDGFDDLIIGAPFADAAGNAKDYAGDSYVIFGTNAGFGASLDLAALTPDQGFVIDGADEDDFSGESVSAAGDVNGDGFDDLIIGVRHADAADNAKTDAGETYVIFGTDTGFGASLDLAALTPDQGFVIYGADEGDFSGQSVSAAGDVNGDGFDDLIIGAVFASAAGNAKPFAGESYVIYGGPSVHGTVFAGAIAADKPDVAATGTSIVDPGSHTGHSLSIVDVLDGTGGTHDLPFDHSGSGRAHTTADTTAASASSHSDAVHGLAGLIHTIQAAVPGPHEVDAEINTS